MILHHTSVVAVLSTVVPLIVGVAGQSKSILELVDPLIGTANGGHVFAGATLPFSMAKAGADVNVENQGGFSTGDLTGNITGFSHMHDSGTGGVSSLRATASRR
jgi:putative alpha-1,2-mannosidase